VSRSGVCSAERGAGTGQLESGCRRPLEGAKPARRGLHLLSPLFGSDTAPAPVTSLRLLVIQRSCAPRRDHCSAPVTSWVITCLWPGLSFVAVSPSCSGCIPERWLRRRSPLIRPCWDRYFDWKRDHIAKRLHAWRARHP
jgi:hypothetical protein